MLSFLFNHVKTINDTKLFAGLMVIVINVSSKFVNIKVSKSMESYLRNTFSRQVLIFAIAWMGTRDIFIALIIAMMFSFVFDYLLNEESAFCCLPENFTDYHLSLMKETENLTISKDDVEKALSVLEKAQAIISRTKCNDIPSSTTVSTGTNGSYSNIQTYN